MILTDVNKQSTSYMTDPSTYVRSEKERGTVMYPNSTPEDIEPPSYESAVAQVPTMSRSVSPVPQPVHGHSSSYQQLPPWTVSHQEKRTMLPCAT